VLTRDLGTLAAPTGSGKTVMGLAVIAARRQPALIVVHNKELLDQWVARIEAFLGIPPQEVGIIGGGKKWIGQKITVGLVQSLYKCAGEVAPHIGFLVADECHRAPARTFTQVLQ
jgi:superfamily II DNA or RNA helicase